MTLFERISKLDRLYLAHDALVRRFDAATDASERGRLRRRARAAWKAYTALRDSRRGIPRAMKLGKGG